jgi:hypothetical protein
MPLITLGSTLAVLVVAIVVVLAVRVGGGTPTGSPSGGVSSPSAGTPAPTPEIPGMDTCVIGVWRVMFHEEEVHNDQLGKLDFTGGEGAKLVLKGDGTGVSDYGSGTEFESTYEGSPIVLEVRGSYTYDFEAEDGQFRVRNLRSEAEARVIVEGDQIGQWIDFRPVGDTASYTCRGDALTQKSLLYTTTFRRID